MRHQFRFIMFSMIALLLTVILYTPLTIRSSAEQATNTPTSTILPTSTPTKLPTQTSTPPPLKSQKYLHDLSLITQKPCGVPCFRGIVVGRTTFTDALVIIRNDKFFSNVQAQATPAAASWSTANGEPCCQLSANDAGIVNALLVKLAPNITTGQVIAYYGQPTYVNSVDYTYQEVAMALIFPKIGLVAWASPGDGTSSLNKSSPIVMILYLDPKDWPYVLNTATLQGWNGYLPYQVYKNAAPVVTPRVTVTPNSGDKTFPTETATP